MKYLYVLLLIIPSFYTFSFSKYCWRKKSYRAGIGSAIMALAGVILPIIFLILFKMGS